MALTKIGFTLIKDNFKDSVSGSSTAQSSSFSTRVTTAETELGNTLLSGSAQIATNISGSLGANASTIRTLSSATVSGSLGANASTIRTLSSATVSGSRDAASISGSRDAVSISGSLGANASNIRTLSAVTVSGSRDAASISGSLGANAGVIRTLSAATVSGSRDAASISGSFGNQRVGTTDDVKFANITGSNNISASGNLSITGNVDVDGTSNFSGNVTLQNDLVVTGRIDAEEIHTTFISSSITQATGSNLFGDATTDSHQFTGSVDISGSLRVSDGNVVVSDTLTATNIGAFTAAGAIDFDNQNMTNVDIDSGTITGITDLTVADGGTGASTAAAAAENLGLGITDDVVFSDVSGSTGTLTGGLDVVGSITGSTVSASTALFTTATIDKIGGAIDFNNENMTNVDIDSGVITGITDLTVADGGTGVSTLTDGGVLLGNGAGAIQAMAVLTDGQMIVGDGTTDPVAESGATLRTSIGVGTTDNVLFAAISASGDISGSFTSNGSFGNIISATHITASGNISSSANIGMDGNLYVGGVVDVAGISLSNNDAGTSNTIFGKSAGLSLDGGSNFNVFIGEGVSTGSMNDAINNVAIGYHALSTVTTGDYNVAIGDHSMMLNKSGEVNVAVGTSALRSNTGDQNTAVGGNAMYSNAGGDNNTVVGHNAGDAMTTTGATVLIGKSAGSAINSADADGTVAIGKDALAALTDGENNIAIGHVAADVMTVSNRNVIIGAEAFTTAATATGQDDNIGIGYRALNNANVQDFNRNIAIGSYALSTTGTNQQTGTIAIGFQALAGNGGGQSNTAIGYNALVSNVAGDKNVALGYQAGEDYNPTADYGNCVFVGHQAGLNVSTARKATVIGNAAVGLGVMTGHENTVIGNEAGYDLTSGGNNTLMGVSAGGNLTIANHNTAVGLKALFEETIGNHTTAIGFNSLNKQLSNTDNEVTGNTAVGSYSGYYNVQGTNNTILGFEAGFGSSTYSHSNNTMVGYQAGKGILGGTGNTLTGKGAGHGITSGDYNTCIGEDAGASTTDTTTGSKNIFIGNYSHGSGVDVDFEHCIGYNIVGNGTKTFTFGENNVDSSIAFGGTSISAPSDERMKEEITTSIAGLSFVNDLRPVTFKWKKEKNIPNTLRGYVEDSETRFKTDTTEHGFIAQEVKTAIDAHSEIKDGFDMWSESPTDGRQRVADGALVPILVKAVQELSQQLEDLKKKVN